MNDIVGFTGVFILLVAYFLHLFKIIGAALACLASVLIHYTPFIILEALWALVSLISIFKLMLKPQ